MTDQQDFATSAHLSLLLETKKDKECINYILIKDSQYCFQTV